MNGEKEEKKKVRVGKNSKKKTPNTSKKTSLGETCRERRDNVKIIKKEAPETLTRRRLNKRRSEKRGKKKKSLKSRWEKKNPGKKFRYVQRKRPGCHAFVKCARTDTETSQGQKG